MQAFYISLENGKKQAVADKKSYLATSKQEISVVEAVQMLCTVIT